MRDILRGVVALCAFSVLAACGGGGASPSPVTAPLDIPRLDGGQADPADAPAAPGTVRFGRVRPAVGARWHVTVSARSAAVDAQGAQYDDYASSYDAEVLATNGPAPSRVRVRFDENRHRSSAGGVERPTPIHGKTYVVDTSAPYVRDATGAPAPAEEAQRVLDNFPDLGTRSAIDQLLPDAPMAVGEPRHQLAGAVLRVIHPRTWSLEEGTATLRGVEEGDGVFAVTLAASSASGLRMRISGDVKVRVRDAQLSSIALDGTYTPADGAFSGTITIRRDVRDR